MKNAPTVAPITSPAKRKRGRPSLDAGMHVVAEHAVAYGITLPPESHSMERFLSPNDIGKILNITGMAVKQWIYRGKLPGVRLANGFWKVRVEDFETYLKNRNSVHRSVFLVTDCSDSGTDAVEQAAEALGAQTLVAHNYADALLKSMEHLPALFVINVSPKDADCWKFAARIRATKALRSVPILLLAGKTISETETEHAVSCGAQGLLARPFNSVTLAQEIERILQRARG